MCTELCPMCKKHDAIIIKEWTSTEKNGLPVEYEDITYFCSALGKDDPDAYFVPPKVMDENLRRIREAFDKLKYLELCPFCGGEAYYHRGNDNIDADEMKANTNAVHFIMCSECSALVAAATEEEAFAAWNRRIR